jgi:hypothetical protein
MSRRVIPSAIWDLFVNKIFVRDKRIPQINIGRAESIGNSLLPKR